MSKKKGWILRITYDGLLAALCAVLGSVAAIDIGIAKLTFENVPVVIAGLLFGPVDGMLVGFVGIFLSQVIRYGIDASTMLWVAPYVLSGLVVGLGAFLCRFRPKFWQLLVILIVDAIVVTGTNTVGLYIYYYYILKTPKETMFAAIPVRLAVSAVKGVLYAILMPLLIKGLESAGIYERPRVQDPKEDRKTPQDEGTDTL
jgi:ECF transporter S component (folate family)